MPVLVDGNNLLFAARDAEDPDRPVGRSMLCDTLGAWAQVRREAVHVIFDGPAPTGSLAEQIGHADIEVSYSGRGVSADEALIHELETNSAARRLIVVSSDHEIIRAAKRRRAKPIASGDFWAIVVRDLSRPPPRRTEPAEKELGLGPGSTDFWLNELGLDESG